MLYHMAAIVWGQDPRNIDTDQGRGNAAGRGAVVFHKVG
jgi:hypothetical protein